MVMAAMTMSSTVKEALTNWTSRKREVENMESCTIITSAGLVEGEKINSL